MEYDIPQFEIKYDYKNREITPDKLKPQNIYVKKSAYNAEEINYEFPYYINLEEIDFKNFQYFETENRKLFLREIIKYIDSPSYVAICGPYGSGKSVTLLKLIMNDEARNFFYINLWTVSTTNLNELKEIFKYECVKLFKENIYELNNKNEKELSSEEKNFKEILNCINNFENKQEIFKLISNIISLLKNIKEKFVIIVDQYSSKYDYNNNNIQSIASCIENSNIKLLICSSMNNDDVKSNLSKSFAIDKESNFLAYIYIGPLIRIYSEYIKNETLSFQKKLLEFGNLFIYYYLLKENERKNKDLNSFLDQEKKNIQKEIENFYCDKNEFIDTKKMARDIIDIIYFINEKRIFFYEDLENLILKLPLKFLEIKRQEIGIIDLKKYASNTQNKDLEEKIKKIDNEELSKTYITSQTKTLFFKSEDIIPRTYKRNYNDLINSLKRPNKKIFIYYLDYLFPLVQDILTNIIYNEAMKYGQLFFTYLDGQSQGGFFEYFILEYIKDKKHFFEYKINGFESIETIVENSYFIQNHSSRKSETKRNYVEKKNVDISKKNQIKIKLPKNNILISQKQFTGKYYDCAFLFPLTKDENDKKFKLAASQISKRKIASQRYYKEEHELILRNVKKNIENKFDVEISEGYFFYIFSSQKLDKNTIEFCNEYNFEYTLFSPDKMEFDYNFHFNLEHSFITNNFPIHNSFSILPPEKFETNNKNKLIFYNEIKSIQKNLITIKISEENEKILNKYFSSNEYFVLGYFDKKFDVTKYCLWYDKSKEEIYYKNFSGENILSEKLIFDKENTDNFVLIGAKNDILYIGGYHSILEYFPPKTK